MNAELRNKNADRFEKLFKSTVKPEDTINFEDIVKPEETVKYNSKDLIDETLLSIKKEIKYAESKIQSINKSEKSEDGHFCRYCFESFELREDVICPCNCRGQNKFVCKSCLNTYMSVNNSDNIKYTKCPTCKTDYLRAQNINKHQIKKYLIITSVIDFSIIVLIFLAMFLACVLNDIVILFVLVILFIITFLRILAPLKEDIYVGYLLFIIPILFFFIDQTVACGLLLILLISLFCLIIFNYYPARCKDLEIRMSKNKKTQMFDQDLKKFVDGVN